MTLDRRTFLKAGAVLGAAGALGPRMVFGATSSPPADTVVVIFLRGGMDPLQTVPPYGDNDYARLRPTIRIPNPGVGGGALPLDNFFGLHPSLAPLLPIYNSKRLAVVHATGLKHDERSHFACQDHLETGMSDLAGAMGHDGHSGWLNRQMMGIGDPGGFYAIGMGSAMQASLRGDASALAMQNLASFSFSSSSARKALMEDQLYRLFGRDNGVGIASRSALDSTDYLAALNPGALPAQNGAVYPGTTFGAQLKEVAQLIRSHSGLRIACIDLGGFDHHNAINTGLPPLLDELARGLAAFNTDLGAAMDNISLLTMTEFGRRVAENASGGTDHGCGSMMFLMGGGVLGGRVYSYWPGLRDSELFNGDLDVTVDYRTVLTELMVKRMGGPGAAEVFPDVAGQPALGCFSSNRVNGDRRIGVPTQPTALA